MPERITRIASAFAQDRVGRKSWTNPTRRGGGVGFLAAPEKLRQANGNVPAVRDEGLELCNQNPAKQTQCKSTRSV